MRSPTCPPLTCMHLIPHVVVVTPSKIAVPPSVWEMKMGKRRRRRRIKSLITRKGAICGRNTERKVGRTPSHQSGLVGVGFLDFRIPFFIPRAVFSLREPLPINELWCMRSSKISFLRVSCPSISVSIFRDLQLNLTTSKTDSLKSDPLLIMANTRWELEEEEEGKVRGGFLLRNGHAMHSRGA